MLIGALWFRGVCGGGEVNFWQNTKRSDDPEGHEDTTEPIALLFYMFDLATFVLFWVEVFIFALCQKRKEGTFQTMKFKESLTVQQRGVRMEGAFGSFASCWLKLLFKCFKQVRSTRM